MRFQIMFRFPELTQLYYVYVDRLSHVKDGFWINDKMQYTTGEDSRYYVLPHMIMSIQIVDDYE